MFRRRLTWFWIALTGVSLVIVARLAQIQIADAAEYEQLAERILTRPVRYIPAPRGTIRDHAGRPLLGDEPSSDIMIHYGALTGRREWLNRMARALRARGDYPAETNLNDIVVTLEEYEIPRMWQRLADLTGIPEETLLTRAAELQERVERVRAVVQRRNPRVRQIAEEDQFLTLLPNVDGAVAIAVRLELERHPWLRVSPATRRVARHADALAHVLGRMGAASPERIADDPRREEELGRLRTDEKCGLSGIERLAEISLRGQRGRILLDYNWRPVERVEPVPGRDVQLTIDLDLQERVLEILARAVEGTPGADPPDGVPAEARAGASAVVIDVATREVRALVSYPTYCYDRFNEDYEQLRRDAQRQPLVFRAVQAQYPPGSICKAITLVGGLTEGVVLPETHIHCTGYYLAEMPDRFRCWIYNIHPGVTHDMVEPEGQDAERAVRNSCNIYFYTVGERLGPQRLCDWFARFGLGRPTGTGLIEEVNGVVPTEEWLVRTAGRRPQSADAWNYSIGQGEVTITPLQAANVAAAIASGVWEPVRLAYDATGHAFGAPPAPPVVFDERHMRVLRRGMWRAVNERGGTGVAAQLERKDYALCGKTGSAQVSPWPLTYTYTFEWPDGQRAEAVAFVEEDARALVGADEAVCVGRRAAERFPRLEEGERLPSHAWFMGFLQPATTKNGERPTGRVYAIAVLIEFGGSGGRVAGPAAKEIAECLLE